MVISICFIIMTDLRRSLSFNEIPYTKVILYFVGHDTGVQDMPRQNKVCLSMLVGTF